MERDSPRYVAILKRQNARIGTTFHRAFRKVVLVYLMGLPIWLTSRALFRFRIVHGERLDALGPRAILALRHYYEWDPPLTYAGIGLCRAFHRGRPPLTISSELWARTAVRRAFSWFLGVLPLVPNHEPEGALGRALELLADGRRQLIAICPTGPIGTSQRYRVGYSVGHLAAHRPDLPVVPVSVMGIQDLSWKRVLTLRRPRITIAFGEPIYASAFSGSSSARQKAVCDRIDEAWRELER